MKTRSQKRVFVFPHVQKFSFPSLVVGQYELLSPCQDELLSPIAFGWPEKPWGAKCCVSQSGGEGAADSDFPRRKARWWVLTLEIFSSPSSCCGHRPASAVTCETPGRTGLGWIARPGAETEQQPRPCRHKHEGPADSPPGSRPLDEHEPESCDNLSLPPRPHNRPEQRPGEVMGKMGGDDMSHSWTSLFQCRLLDPGLWFFPKLSSKSLMRFFCLSSSLISTPLQKSVVEF